MKNIYYLIAISCIVFSSSLNAQWVQTNGPYGGYISSLGVSGENIFAGTLHGIYISTNNGTNWAPAGLANKTILFLVVSGANIFAAVDVNFGEPAGVYLTTDNGTNWIQVNNGLSDAHISSLVISGSDIYASSWDGVFFSSNNGTDWANISNNLPISTINCLAGSESKIYVGTSDGVFLSTNNGSNWVQVNNGLTSTYVSSLAIIGANVFAAVDVPFPEPARVYLTTDNGTNWIPVTNGLSSFSSLVVIGTNIFAGTDSGIFLSSNNGTNWTLVTPDGPAVRCFTFGSKNIFAGTSAGVLKSTDNGINWTPVNNGLNIAEVTSLTVSGDDIYVGTSGGGMFLSTDNGTNWKQKNMNLANSGNSVSSILVIGDNIFAGTSHPNSDDPIAGVYLSTDNGVNWTKIKSGRTWALFNSGNNVFASGLFGLLVTTDDGANWTKLNIGQNHPNVSCFAVIGTNIFAGTAYYDAGEGVFLSTNNGTSWAQVSNGLNNLNVFSLAVSGTNIFAGTAENGGVYLSSDNGANWTLVNNGLPDTTIHFNNGFPDTTIHSLMVSGSNIFATTGTNGVYLSTNNGTDWRSINDGLPSDFEVYDLAVTKDNILASTLGRGVWRRPLSEVTAISNEERVIPTEYNLSQNFPNPFNPTTTIGYVLQEKSNTKLTLINVIGEEVAILVNEEHDKGYHKVDLNAANLPSGVYLYKLQAGNFIETKKLMLLK